MKNTFICFVICFSLSSIFCNAQIRTIMPNGYNIDWFIWDKNKSRLQKKDNKIKQETITIKGKAKNAATTSSYALDGRIAEFHSDAKNHFKIAYHNDSLIEQITYYNYNVINERDSSSYSGSLIKNKYKLDKNNRIVASEEYTRDSIYTTKYVYSKLIKGKMKEFRKQVYEYYPDYSFKKITYYKKGKPTHFSVFDCNPIGESHKISKDSTYNCIKYDIDSLGNKIKVTIINERNVPLKQVEYFDEKNQRIASKLFDITSNKLILVYYFLPGKMDFTKYIIYNKGKEYYKTENTFNANNICTETKTYRRGKLKETVKNTFNDKELIESSIKYNRKNKKKTETTYAYQHY